MSSTAPTGSWVRVHLLGTSGALTSALRDTTALALETPSAVWLIDCPGAVVQKLTRAGIGLQQVAGLVFTHDHADHVYGLPHLIQAMMVAGIDAELAIHAPAATVVTLRGMAELHGLEAEPYPGLRFRDIPLREGAAVLQTEHLTLRATPAVHGPDTVGLRVDVVDDTGNGGGALGYSADSGPNEALAELCRGVDVLLHDCGGLQRHRDGFPPTHASALEAGQVAAAAGARSLVLIHLGPGLEEAQAEAIVEARGAFPGPVRVGCDGEVICLPAASP